MDFGVEESCVQPQKSSISTLPGEDRKLIKQKV